MKMPQASLLAPSRAIFFASFLALLLLSCNLLDNGLTQDPATPVEPTIEESTMPDETALPNQDETPEPAADNGTPPDEANGEIVETETVGTITSEVVFPDYEPLDLPYSQWEVHRSKELLAANGFGDAPAEWRRAAEHHSGLIRGTAIYLLTRQPDPQDEALFRQELEDIDETAQALAAFGLARLGDTSALPTLQRIADLDVNANLAAPRAAGLLAELGDPTAFATIARAMTSGQGYIRLSAVQFVPPFVPLHGQSYGAEQPIDIWALYCQALEDPDIQVRAVAELQLQEINSAEALQVLEDCSTLP